MPCKQPIWAAGDYGKVRDRTTIKTFNMKYIAAGIILSALLLHSCGYKSRRNVRVISPVYATDVKCAVTSVDTNEGQKIKNTANASTAKQLKQ